MNDDRARRHGTTAGPVGARNFSSLPQMPHGTSKTIGSVIGGFKIGVTKWCRQYTDIVTVWQRNYYEHIIRNEESLNRIREYIVNNPSRWEIDRGNPHMVLQNGQPLTGQLHKGAPTENEPWHI